MIGIAPPVLGVLGGMGPLATADFQAKLARLTPAARDQDHVPLLVIADPRTPDRTEAILGRGPSPLPWLLSGARSLVACGAGAVVMPCNTAHHWAADVEAACGDVPLLSIVNAVKAAARATGACRLGLLATSGTIRSRVYQNAFGEADPELVVPDERAQDRVQSAVLAVKGGRVDEATAVLREVAESLIARGAQSVVLACTEIPVALAGWDPHPMIDATSALARHALDWWIEAAREAEASAPSEATAGGQLEAMSGARTGTSSSSSATRE